MTPNVQAAYDRLVNVHGLPPSVAAGLVGQFVAESGGALNTGAFNPRDPGGSYGIGQWNRGRRDALNRFRSDAPDELSRQVDFAVSELRGTHRRILDAMMAAQGDPRAMTRAAVAFEAPQGFTRANPEGAHGFDRRLAATQSLWGGPSGDTTTATPTATAATAATIQQVRERLAAQFPKLRFTSGDRSPEYNARVGGAKNSQHTHGTAVDIGLREFDDATRQQIVDAALGMGVRGIGYYPGSQSIHIDMRPGAVAAWGPNYSRTSLGQTPTWFQDRANRLFAGGYAPASTDGQTQVAAAGAPASVSSGTAAPAAPPQNTAEGLFEQGFADLFGGGATPAPTAQAQAPEAPAATPAMQQDQGSAASLMASLIERKRAERGVPGMFETGIFG